jgi:hypothetical protein
VIACGGVHETDDKLNPLTATRWVFGNFNDVGNIIFTRVRVYFPGGSFDSSNGDIFPTAWAAMLFPTLEPHESIKIRSEDLYPLILNKMEDPYSYYGGNLQLILEWTADTEMVPPLGHVIVASFGQKGGALVAKHDGDCSILELQ